MRNETRVVRTVRSLRRTLEAWTREGERIALVPTMGALHTGHMALVRAARRKAERVVVSIFVNPAQFAPNEDFATYPRTFRQDVRKLSVAGVDLVYAPAVEQMYPDGFATRIVPDGAAVAGLEDTVRPHFFGGVATVVGKLLLQVRPDLALFGEKDYQQLKVVTRLARDLDLDTRVVGVPTVREKDGLALSSRNVYLSEGERGRAVALPQALRKAAEAIASGQPVARALSQGRAALARAGFQVDYFEARDAETLAPLKRGQRQQVRLLAAARLGSTRLIDNLAVPQG
ncbi:pantoate--beta-alanine ligase [Blastochloris viridis]|uniref:Pantothenate synthetase n=1 Tax=Blastochloris viridis TaxID=1079 RepID=A0A0H5BIC9_BLAVI|nr:pantoate--beta-alanine ligase [Blastochloris viridis]ALK09236.1 Pantothenate synthetase [Blastochloris viridis]BAS00895.1 pantoate--beta-alanine ligase [Blastochloris viridis]CUU41899.1 Pantothenate synthetase [Blastochloris viridis]